MKKYFALLAAVVMICSLCSCGNVSVTVSSSVSSTVIDATDSTDENTDDDAAYPAGSCGEACQDGEEHTVDVSIVNDTGADITAFYCVVSSETSWSNLFGDDEYLGDGSTATDYLTLHYSADSMSFDMGLKHEGDEEPIEFESTDISTLPADGFTITFTEDGWKAK